MKIIAIITIILVSILVMIKVRAIALGIVLVINLSATIHLILKEWIVISRGSLFGN